MDRIIQRDSSSCATTTARRISRNDACEVQSLTYNEDDLFQLLPFLQIFETIELKMVGFRKRNDYRVYGPPSLPLSMTRPNSAENPVVNAEG